MDFLNSTNDQIVETRQRVLQVDKVFEENQMRGLDHLQQKNFKSEILAYLIAQDMITTFQKQKYEYDSVNSKKQNQIYLQLMREQFRDVSHDLDFMEIVKKCLKQYENTNRMFKMTTVEKQTKVRSEAKANKVKWLLED